SPRRTTPAGLCEIPLKVVSAADGTWKYSLDKPEGPGWKSLSFDDRDWHALTHAPTPRLAWSDFGARQANRCTELGAACLKVAPPALHEVGTSLWERLIGQRSAIGGVWIRKSFEVPTPLLQGSQGEGR